MFKDRGEVSVAGVEKIRKRVGKNKALPPQKKTKNKAQGVMSTISVGPWRLLYRVRAV